jgi:hypothetical protein
MNGEPYCMLTAVRINYELLCEIVYRIALWFKQCFIRIVWSTGLVYRVEHWSVVSCGALVWCIVWSTGLVYRVEHWSVVSRGALVCCNSFSLELF